MIPHDHIPRASILRHLGIALLCVFSASALLAQGLTWEGIGPAGGGAYSFASDSEDALYAYHGGSGGLYRSTDRGDAWTLVANRRLSWISTAGTTLTAVDDSARVVVSTDRGATWRTHVVRTPAGDSNVIRVMGSPDGTIYAQLHRDRYPLQPTNMTLMRSTDAGASWLTIVPRDTVIVRFVGIADGTLFILRDRSILRSEDGGATLLPVTGLSRQSIAVVADGQGTMYSLGDNLPLLGRVLLASSDRGATWTPFDTLDLDYHLAILGVTASGTLLVADRAAVLSSTDDGATWRSSSTGSSADEPRSLVTIGDDVFLAIQPPGNFAGNGDVLRSTDAGATFTSISRGLAGLPVGRVVVSDGHLFALGEGEVFHATLAEREWRREEYVEAGLTAGPDGTLYRVASIPDGSGRTRLARSTDRGATWTLSDTVRIPGFRMLGVAPDGLVVYASQWFGLWGSRDHGATWTALDSNFLEPVTAMAFDSVGGILVGTETAGLQRRERARGIFVPLPARLNNIAVRDIAIGPDSAIYAIALGVPLRRSTNNGATFVDVAGPYSESRLWSVAVARSGALLVATDSGLYMSRNRGTGWGFEGVGLPRAVSDIALLGDERLVVGTSNGVYVSAQSVASAPRREAIPIAARIAVSPNPSASDVRIEVHVPRSARVRARVVDVRGAVVATVHDGDLGSGASSLVWSAEDIATGQYRIVVDIDGVVSSRGVVIAR